MLLVSIVVGSLLGGVGFGVWISHSRYAAKAKAIQAEIQTWETSHIAEVRTLVARLKAFL